MLKAWDTFRRSLVTLATEALAKVRRRAGESFHNPVTGEELQLADFVTYLRVLEWTPGTDGVGHPHFHLWMVSPFLRKRAVQVAWSRAWSRAAGVRRLCMVDVRRVEGDTMRDGDGATSSVAAELCKYLTKDWIDGSAGERVSPSVFAQVWCALDGRRLRQSSAGFASFEVGVLKVCPSCETELTRWSLYIRDPHRDPPRRIARPLDLPDVPNTGPPPERWRAIEERRTERWREDNWAELRVLRLRLARITGSNLDDRCEPQPCGYSDAFENLTLWPGQPAYA
jgi:hypothetical protein